MELQDLIPSLIPWGVMAIFVVAIVGIFVTKKEGFGRYTTSVLVLTLILFVVAMALILGKVEWSPIANILFAMVGFAGGLIAERMGGAVS